MIYMGLLFSLLSYGKEKETTPPEITLNIGATIGFNTAFPIINSISVDNVELENMRLLYKVGHQASFFCRVNIDRFFIQPSINWNRTEGDILFPIPSVDPVTNTFTSVETEQNARLEMEKKSLHLPVFIGYHIVREGPYGLSFIAGPNFKYDYSVNYKSTSPEAVQEFVNESTPVGVGISVGIAVKIWQLFFDFSYEFGLNHTESDFKSKNPETPLISNNIKIDKRTNMMSFSLGIVF